MTTTLPQFRAGDHLLIELANNDNECFVGQLHFQNPAGTRLELANVRNFSTNEEFQSVQIFYRKEIRSVRLLPSTSDEAASSTTPISTSTTTASPSADATASETSTSSPSPTPSSSSSSNACRLTAAELQRISDDIQSPVYHPNTDCHFYAAVGALQRQSCVALSVGYAYQGLRSSVGQLTITGGAVNHNEDDEDANDDEAARIHIFDIATMGGRIPTVLRTLLTSVRPHKIMHDSTLAAYVLRTAYDCHVRGVFEVRMAHATLGGGREQRSLGSLLEQYLHVPRHTVDGEMAAGEAAAVDWTHRPLTAELRSRAAQQVAYLPALHEVLLYERMLGAFYEGCDRFAHEYTKDADEVDVACRVSMRERVEPAKVVAAAAAAAEDGGKVVDLRRLRPFRVREMETPVLRRLEELEI